MERKRKIFFESRLEYKFYQAYKALPFDFIECMVDSGYSRSHAIQTVQRIMDNIWQREKEINEQNKQREEEWQRYIKMANEINPFTGEVELPT